MRKSYLTSLLVALTTCSGTTVQGEIIGPTDGSQPLAIVNVNLVPMDRDHVIRAQTVVIRNGRIASIAASSTAPPPSDALVIDGRNGYLLPGLIDMHVHIRSAELEDYLRGGITTVRNMWGYTTLGAIVEDVNAGRLKGPRIFSLTAGFDGAPAIWPETQISDDVTAIAALIDRQHDLGYREVKTYQKLSRAAYDTIVAIAKRKGMTFAGHRPAAVPLSHVLASGQRSIEHLGGYVTGSGLDAQVAATTVAGTYNCPTLAIQTMLNGEATSARLREIVGALHRGGARLLVGSDSGIDRTQPGISIHDELELFVRSGLSPYEALLGATRTAAEYLGQKAHVGGIAVGMEADVILLRANPLENIRATRDIRAVVYDGRVF